MVKIRYLNRKGDEVVHMPLKQAQAILANELEHGSLVLNGDLELVTEEEREKRIMDRAGITKNLEENSAVTVYRPICGG